MRSLLRLLALLLIGEFPAPASAAVPSPVNSSLPPCMVLCPLGDIGFTVVVRDLANNAIAGSSVTIDLSACSAAFICSALPTDPYSINLPARTIRAFTGVNGSVTFPARIGGTGAAGCVRVFADGVLLRQFALASPDQDGEGTVVSIIGMDDAIFASKLGTSDPTADFNCDGDVDVNDEQIFFAHHSHSCFGFVDAARRGTWGTLKAHYR